ncbi:MAG: hypothetical protein O7E52_07415 [Candidatus Poribacteria bacterium]|nr:hypothetical protein [Candidatus Poribacteria bacterium]
MQKQIKPPQHLFLFISLGSVLLVAGCIGGSTSGITWSDNIAVYAASKDSKLNDDNINSVGETSALVEEARDEKSVAESDKYTEALLEWGKPQTIQKIIIKADVGELEFFDIEYQGDNGKWQTIRRVKDHVKPEYKVQFKKPITTRKLRLKVPRKWESRRMGGQKRSRVRSGRFGGTQSLFYKKIRDIEVYYALPASEAAATQ